MGNEGVMQMKWLRRFIIAILVLTFLFVVYKGLSVLPGNLNKQKYEITVVIKSMEPSMEFWQVLIDGVEVAAKEFDVNVTVTGPPNESDIDEQIRIIDEAIKAQPDAIVMAATDYNRLVPAALTAKKNGISLITIDSGINSEVADSFIATDNFEAGRKAGKAMADNLEDNAKVAIISFVQGTATQIDRESGVLASLEEAGITVMGTYYSDGVEGKAYQITKELSEKHDDLRGIVGLNETSTVGAGKAIRDLGLAGQIQLIGFDSSINEVKLLEEGVMQATIVQKPFNMGYLGIKTAVEALRKERIPDIIDTGSVIITKDNMYMDENQKLLFPFVEK
jgi:ribose transport system substrate-binding protein